MKQGFIKANSSNLPKIDVLMLGAFLGANNDFISSEFRNVKTSIQCHKEFTSESILNTHIRKRRCPGPPTEGDRKCPICAGEFGSFAGLRLHTRRVHPGHYNSELESGD